MLLKTWSLWVTGTWGKTDCLINVLPSCFPSLEATADTGAMGHPDPARLCLWDGLFPHQPQLVEPAAPGLVCAPHS